MVILEAVCGNLLDDIQDNVDFSYNGWNPTVLVWRARETNPKQLPYVVVDFISTSNPMFQSMGGDIVGEIDDRYHEYAYCELELINISVCANKYHKNRTIRGNDWAKLIATRIRKRVYGFWNRILNPEGHSLDRKRRSPIRNLSGYKPEVGTRWYEYDMDVYVRTDVRWNNKPEDEDDIDERAEKAYIQLKNTDDNIITNMRIVYDG